MVAKMAAVVCEKCPVVITHPFDRNEIIIWVHLHVVLLCIGAYLCPLNSPSNYRSKQIETGQVFKNCAAFAGTQFGDISSRTCNNFI